METRLKKMRKVWYDLDNAVTSHHIRLQEGRLEELEVICSHGSVGYA